MEARLNLACAFRRDDFNRRTLFASRLGTQRQQFALPRREGQRQTWGLRCKYAHAQPLV